MIQRVQTIYLALIVVLSLLLLTGSVFNCMDETGQAIRLMLSGNLTDMTGQPFAKVSPLWPLLLLLILLATGSFTGILLFKKRRIQMMISSGIIILSAGLITALILYARTVTHSYKLTIQLGIKAAVPLVILILSLLAFYAIRRDDRLVKSYDRLR